jgi:hypothetical protein
MLQDAIEMPAEPREPFAVRIEAEVAIGHEVRRHGDVGDGERIARKVIAA